MISWTIYLTPEQDERVKRLRELTGIPVSVVIREGLNIALASREKDFREQRTRRSS